MSEKKVQDKNEVERLELWSKINETKSKIQERIVELLAHPNVPEHLKSKLEKFVA